MIEWDLRPLVGFGPLRFGMSPTEVNEILGPPRFQKLYAPTDFRESRGKGPRSYDVILGYNPDILTDATFPFQANDITVFGLQVFHVSPADLVDALKKANGGRYALCGYELAFDKLGLVLSDWLDADSSDRWIAAISAEDYAMTYGKKTPDKIVT